MRAAIAFARRYYLNGIKKCDAKACVSATAGPNPCAHHSYVNLWTGRPHVCQGLVLTGICPWLFFHGLTEQAVFLNPKYIGDRQNTSNIILVHIIVLSWSAQEVTLGYTHVRVQIPRQNWCYSDLLLLDYHLILTDNYSCAVLK